MTQLNEMKQELQNNDKKVILFPHFLNDKTLSREEFDIEFQDWMDKALRGELPEEPTEEDLKC